MTLSKSWSCNVVDDDDNEESSSSSLLESEFNNSLVCSSSLLNSIWAGEEEVDVFFLSESLSL